MFVYYIIIIHLFIIFCLFTHLFLTISHCNFLLGLLLLVLIVKRFG